MCQYVTVGCRIFPWAAVRKPLCVHVCVSQCDTAEQQEKALLVSTQFMEPYWELVLSGFSVSVCVEKEEASSFPLLVVMTFSSS